MKRQHCSPPDRLRRLPTRHWTSRLRLFSGTLFFFFSRFSRFRRSGGGSTFSRRSTFTTLSFHPTVVKFMCIGNSAVVVRFGGRSTFSRCGTFTSLSFTLLLLFFMLSRFSRFSGCSRFSRCSRCSTFSTLSVFNTFSRFSDDSVNSVLIGPIGYFVCCSVLRVAVAVAGVGSCFSMWVLRYYDSNCRPGPRHRCYPAGC